MCRRAIEHTEDIAHVLRTLVRQFGETVGNQLSYVSRHIRPEFRNAARHPAHVRRNHLV